MIKGIFWDNDGVLVDTERLYFRATAETLAPLGIELSQEEFSTISLGQGRSLLDLAQTRGVPPGEMDRLRRKRNTRYAELLRETKTVVPGIPETLQKLHGRVFMAVVTGSRRDHFDIIHRNSGLLPFFDFVLVREDYHHAKPHPEAYRLALARSGLPPEACVVIEDSERGVKAAQNAGLRCWALPSALSPASRLCGAERILEKVTEVPRLAGIDSSASLSGRENFY